MGKPWKDMNRDEQKAAKHEIELAAERAMDFMQRDLSAHLKEQGVPFALKITVELEPL